MKIHSLLGVSILTSVCAGLGAAACGEENGSRGAASATASTSASGALTAPSMSSSPMGTGAGSTNMPAATTDPQTNMGGIGGASGMDMATGGAGGASGTAGPTAMCDVAPLAPFSRSDTDAAWDDNDFSDVVVESGCPVLVNVTWPHEEGWENADPSEANHEQTHFTLDSYQSMDLTDKQLNLTIELTDDQRGPNANVLGGYRVSIVSVSTFDRIVVVESEPVAEPEVESEAGVSLLDAGVGGASGVDDSDIADASMTAVDAGSDMSIAVTGDAGSIDADAGAAEAITTTETGYQEAESPLEDRALLRHVGDRATITLPLPLKTEAEDSYDPTRVIKVNVRIYNEYSTGEMMTDEMPMDPTGDVDTMATDRVYDYLTSQFAITRFSISDVGPLP